MAENIRSTMKAVFDHPENDLEALIKADDFEKYIWGWVKRRFEVFVVCQKSSSPTIIFKGNKANMNNLNAFIFYIRHSETEYVILWK